MPFDTKTLQKAVRDAFFHRETVLTFENSSAVKKDAACIVFSSEEFASAYDDAARQAEVLLQANRQALMTLDADAKFLESLKPSVTPEVAKLISRRIDQIVQAKRMISRADP